MLVDWNIFTVFGLLCYGRLFRAIYVLVIHVDTRRGHGLVALIGHGV